MPTNRLRKLREVQGIAPERIALTLGVSRHTYDRWETGQTSIKDHHKQGLAELFGVSIPYLMGWDEAGWAVTDPEKSAA